MSEIKVDNSQVSQPAATPAEPPKPTLAEGLFKPFQLGSTLAQGEVGNVMHNLKKPMMDYEKQYQGATKNESVSAEDLQKLGEVKKAKAAEDDKKDEDKKKKEDDKAKKSMTEDEAIANVPEEQRPEVIAELDRRIEEARKSNNEVEAQTIEKAKEKAKKCWGPQMDQKQSKESDMK